MPDEDPTNPLEERIAEWRTYVSRRQAIDARDTAELEDHLREQVSALVAAGLDDDEAFLIAVKRLGDLDALSREFAAEHSGRLWKQLVVAAPDSEEKPARVPLDAIVAFGLAVAAAVLIKVPALFGYDIGPSTMGFYDRNAAFFVFPLLAGYFVWMRHLGPKTWRWIAAAFVVAFAIANAYPFVPRGSTEGLTALHLPIALWLAVGIAYAGGRWREVSGRMDFIRFSGELAIYYVLIALGGGLLTGLLSLLFQAVGVDPGGFISSWLLPCGAAGAVLVAAWLVETKKSVIENMAPVLTRLFSPLFTLVLLAFLGTVVLTGHGIDIKREVLIAFDLLLAVVLALVLYTISARDPEASPGLFDWLQVVLVGSALLADAVALWAIGARISEFGFSPNRVAALGENLILLVNLGWCAVLYVRFLARRGTFAAIEKWQTDYVPVYAIWAAFVVVAFPLFFAFK